MVYYAPHGPQGEGAATVERYDVAIIGGGVAGLATGALLAKAGRRVAVLEKGNQLGGRAYTYTDQGFVLNYGPHAMYRPHTGLLGRIQRRLELPPIPAPYPDPHRSFFRIDDRWGSLGPRPHEALLTTLFPVQTRVRLLPLMAGIRFGDPAHAGALTLGEWLEQRVSDPLLRRFLLAFATLNTYTRPASDLSAQFVLRHLQRTLFVRDYAGYITGGWSTMYGAFASVISDCGGALHTGASVVGLALDGERITSALTFNGPAFEAEAFVLTVPPQDAPQLAEPDTPLRAELDRWAGLQDVRALCLDLGLSRRLRTEVSFIYDGPYDLYFSLHSEVTPDLAPPGGQLLHAMAYLSPEEADDRWLNERRQQELEAGLDRYFPGWREATAVCRPLRSALVTAARQTPDQQGAARVPLRSSVAANLYFAGDARDLPFNLTEISLAAAIEASDAIVRDVALVAQ